MPSGYVKSSHWFCRGKPPRGVPYVLPDIFFGKNKVESKTFCVLASSFLKKLF